jgi:streptomycin 6-kinase
MHIWNPNQGKVPSSALFANVIYRMFEKYLERWKLAPDGDPIITRGSRLLPVRMGNTPAMLKIALDAEEKFGGALMSWWEGHGAAHVFAHEEDALLMARAEDLSSLLDMALTGRDDEASRIICNVVAQIHAPRLRPPPALIPLAEWFQALRLAVTKYHGCRGYQGDYGYIFPACAAIADRLLQAPQDVVVLHGDIHHRNILDFGNRGWLAIDPKHIVGERGFDYANLFCNPELETVRAPGRMVRQLQVVAEAAGLERARLLQWIVAYAGLSAAWFLEDGDTESAQGDLAIAALALMELGESGELGR